MTMATPAQRRRRSRSELNGYCGVMLNVNTVNHIRESSRSSLTVSGPGVLVAQSERAKLCRSADAPTLQVVPAWIESKFLFQPGVRAGTFENKTVPVTLDDIPGRRRLRALCLYE
jgi:hypothetical protein